MKALKIKLGNREYPITLTPMAKFKIDALLGGANIVDATIEETEQSLKNTCEILAIMIEQTELSRRYLKYDPADYPSAEEIEKIVLGTMTVGDLQKLKADIYDACVLGYGREIHSAEKEIDLVLQEIEQKKTGN